MLGLIKKLYLLFYGKYSCLFNNFTVHLIHFSAKYSAPLFSISCRIIELNNSR